MLAISLAGNSWAHRTRVGPKMLALALVSIVSFWIENWLILSVLLLGVAGLYRSISGSAMKTGLAMLQPLLWIVALIWIFHILRGEFEAGAVVCLRLMMLVSLANFVTLTSRLTDMTDLFLWLLSPLEKIGVSTAPIGLALGMVMRFTPVLIERAGRLIESWRARAKKRASWRIILPLFITVVDDADRVAEALRARGGVK